MDFGGAKAGYLAATKSMCVQRISFLRIAQLGAICDGQNPVTATAFRRKFTIPPTAISSAITRPP